MAPPSRLEEKNEQEELVEDAAKEYGLSLPRRGTPVFQRLIDTCIEYARRVDYGETSPRLKIDESLRGKSDAERRRWHNELCVMLKGMDHAGTSFEDRRRISNFAMTVAGMDQYVGTF